MDNQAHTWRYAAIKKTNTYDGSTFWVVAEVYRQGDKHPDSWTEDAVEPFGDTYEELSECLELMISDLKKPASKYEVEPHGIKLTKID